MEDDPFEPKLGRMRARGAGRGRAYLHRVLQAVALAGVARSRPKGFHGNHIGRGVGAGRVLASRGPAARIHQRRVIVKSRIVKLAGKGLAAAHAHLRYLQRDGTTGEGAPGSLYGSTRDVEDGKAFLDRATGDRHQFRLIVSAEDGADYLELHSLTRRLLAQMEQDLGTRLDWVAVDHFNTGHPHTHILLRGVDDRGKDLILAREYLSAGIRERAAELVTLDLGPRTQREIEQALVREVEQERWTSLDRRLVAAQDPRGWVVARAETGRMQAMLAGRLAKLSRLGLAEEVVPGRWRMAESAEELLRRMGERGDVLKTLHRDLQALGRDAGESAWFEPGVEGAQSLIGALLARGLSDELRDRHYCILDATDGRAHYVDIGRGDGLEPAPVGAILRITPREASVSQVDRTIAEIAGVNGGIYSVDRHLAHDSHASQAFAETHVRRLEAIRRATGGVERRADGSWSIAADHLDRVAAYEARRLQQQPVAVEILSRLPLDQQAGFDGATWLDQAPNAEVAVRDAGFGREVSAAQAARRRWLQAQGLIDPTQGEMRVPAAVLATLRRRELLRVAGQLAQELGLDFVETRAGDRIEGVVKRPVDLASGRFALIERSRDFTLVPWRPVLERQLGKPVGGIARDGGIDWTIGRARQGPSIS